MEHHCYIIGRAKPHGTPLLARFCMGHQCYTIGRAHLHVYIIAVLLVEHTCMRHHRGTIASAHPLGTSMLYTGRAHLHVYIIAVPR